MVGVRPSEEIRLVKENLAFAVAFWKAAAAGSVPPDPLLRPTPTTRQFNQPTNNYRQESELSAELTRGAANQMRAAFALSALQTQRSLTNAFPGEPIQQELPELRAALSAMHLIGLAVQNSILQPVWNCPSPYRRLFQVRRLGFTLNATGLTGRPLSWDDFGGLDCYLSLLEYCAASADAPEKTPNRPQTILPTHLSQTEHTGLISAPQTPTNEPTAPPKDYPGETHPTPTPTPDRSPANTLLTPTSPSPSSPNNPTHPNNQPANPAHPENQPAHPTDNPTHPDNQPANPTANPANPTNQLAQPTDNPTHPNNQPANPAGNPAHPNNQPANPTDNPTHPTNQPANLAGNPAHPNNQPANPTDNPAHPKNQAANPTSEPPPTPNLPKNPPDTTQNPIDQFITQHCETGPEKRILAGELYAAFLQWCHDTNQKPPSQRAFGMRLTTLGLQRKRRGHGKHWWQGIHLTHP